jgi:hypothetical protein
MTYLGIKGDGIIIRESLNVAEILLREQSKFKELILIDRWIFAWLNLVVLTVN